MNKLILSSLLFSCLIGNVYAVCNYDLDGFLYDPNNPSSQKFPVVSNQKLSYKTLSSPQSIQYSANHSSLEMENNSISKGALSMPLSGVVGFELNTEVFPIELKGQNMDVKNYGILIPDTNNNTHMILVTYANNSSLTYKDDKKNVVFILISSVHPDTKQNESIYGYGIPIEGVSKQNIAIYFNQNTNQVGLIVNKNNLGYVATLFSKPKAITFVPQAFFGGFEKNSQYLNQNMSLELVTDKSKFTNAFPNGTKDICGS